MPAGAWSQALSVVSFRLTAQGRPLEMDERHLPVPGPGQVLLGVAGCVLGQNEVALISGAVAPGRALPLVPGSGSSGVVIRAGAGCEELLGRPVLVPGVLPCGECELCRGGRANACPTGARPGHDLDGGLATHLLVPGRSLVTLEEPVGECELWELAAVSQMISSAFQCVLRAGIGRGDLAVFVGLGSVGSFGVQVAAAFGATVFGVDVSPQRLQRLFGLGLTMGFDASERRTGGLRAAVEQECRERGLPKMGWKVFDMSGSCDGREAALGLMSPGGIVGIVGSPAGQATLDLSSLTRMDASVFGSWGCSPVHFPAVLELLRSRKLVLSPFVRRFALEDVNDVVRMVAGRVLNEIPVLVP